MKTVVIEIELEIDETQDSNGGIASHLFPVQFLLQLFSFFLLIISKE